MTLTEKEVACFKQLYLKHFYLELSDEDARAKLSKLTLQMKTIYQPVMNSEIKSLSRICADKTRKGRLD